MFKKLLGLLLAMALVIPVIPVTPVSAADSADYVAQYRFYNPGTGEHFYTTDVNERNVLASNGWNYEGINCLIPGMTDTPMYRLYHPVTGDHHYTTDAHERDVIIAQAGWKDEGIGWYSGGDTPVYRLYNPKLTIGAHHYTSDTHERSVLLNSGWKDEGIGWYGNSAKGYVDPNPLTPAKPEPQPQQNGGLVDPGIGFVPNTNAQANLELAKKTYQYQVAKLESLGWKAERLTVKDESTIFDAYGSVVWSGHFVKGPVDQLDSPRLHITNALIEYGPEEWPNCFPTPGGIYMEFYAVVDGVPLKPYTYNPDLCEDMTFSEMVSLLAKY